MPHRHAISDADWDRIKDLLPGRPGQTGWLAEDNRLFIDAVLWWAKTGVPWRNLPERFGNWNSVWRRFNRWSRKGTWRRVFEALQDPDLEWLILDSTVIRAHPAPPAPKKKRRDGGPGRAGLRPQPEQLRDQGPRRGQRLGAAREVGADAGAGGRRDPGRDADRGRAVRGRDRGQGYDSQAVVDAVEAKGGEAVIPTQKNRKVQRDIDRERYRDRNLVERFGPG